MKVFGSVSVDCGSFLCQTSWIHGVEPVEWVQQNRVLYHPSILGVHRFVSWCFLYIPTSLFWKLGVLASAADICQAEASLPMKTVLQRGQGQYLPTMTCVSICNSSMSWFRCFLFADVYTDGFYWANTHLFKSYHHIMHPISFSAIRLNCFEQLSQFVALATWGHGGELLQEQTVIVECLDGLEEHCHHLCLKPKKKPACHRAPVFEGFWHPLLWINMVDSSLFTPGEVVSHCFDCQLCSGLIPRFLSKPSRLP